MLLKMLVFTFSENPETNRMGYVCHGGGLDQNWLKSSCWPEGFFLQRKVWGSHWTVLTSQHRAKLASPGNGNQQVVIWWCPSALGVFPAALRFLLPGLKQLGSSASPASPDTAGLLVSFVMLWRKELSRQLWCQGSVLVGRGWEGILYHCECYWTPQKAESLESIHAVDHFPELSVLHEPPAHESWKKRSSQEICGASSPS